MGISAEMLPLVFDLFIQSNRTYRNAQGGLGIGLTLVRRLVEMHKGTVKVFSAGEGKGSEFVVTLPLTSEPEHTEVEKSEPVERISSVPKILVVDDNEDCAESMSLLIEEMGADVKIANDGKSALKVFLEFQPSIAFLDIGMPDMDGYELARRLRELAEGRNVNLVALTGWGQDEDRRRSKAAGFNHHFVKPVDSDQLRQYIAKHSQIKE